MFSSVKFVGNFWHCYSLKCTQQLFVKLELIFRCFQAHSKCSVVGTTASLGAYHSPGTFEWTSGRQCLHGWSVGLANPPQLTWGNGWYSFLWKKKKNLYWLLTWPSWSIFYGICRFMFRTFRCNELSHCFLPTSAKTSPCFICNVSERS